LNLKHSWRAKPSVLACSFLLIEKLKR